MIKGTKLFKVTVSDGQIDPKPYNKYEDFDSSEPTGTLAEYLEKAKALYRWYVMSMNLSKGLETLSNISVEADSKTVPSEVSFVLTYTQPDALWVEVDEADYDPEDKIENDKLRDGRVIFMGKKAIKRIIETTLAHDYSDESVVCTFASQFNPERITKTSEFMPYSDSPMGESFRGIIIEGVSGASIEVEEILDYKQFEK